MSDTIRTASDHPDFIELVKQLDAHLATRDGTDHRFYAQFNKIDKISHVIIVYDNNIPCACGAIKELDAQSMEIKRMFTVPDRRGKGLGSLVLGRLEQWAKELGYLYCRLETGKRQPEAIALYHKNGYLPINNYGQYAGVENSVCFEKKL